MYEFHKNNGGGAQNLIVTYEHIAYYNYNFCCKIILLLYVGGQETFPSSRKNLTYIVIMCMVLVTMLLNGHTVNSRAVV